MYTQLSRIEYVHQKNFIHRDVKPDNFLIGTGKYTSVVNIIDFGLAKRYKDPKTMEHIQFSDKKSLTGTARYASIHAHLGYEQSRRDDLESIGYILIYFLKGSLPWQGMVQQKCEDKYKKIKEIKISTPLQVLCNELPSEFMEYLYYCRELKFEKDPDYKKLRQLFNDLYTSNKFADDGTFDWNIVELSSFIKNDHISRSDQVRIHKLLNHVKKKHVEDGKGGVPSPLNRSELGVLNMSLKVNNPEELLKPVAVARGPCCSKGMHFYVGCIII